MLVAHQFNTTAHPIYTDAVVQQKSESKWASQSSEA